MYNRVNVLQPERLRTLKRLVDISVFARIVTACLVAAENRRGDLSAHSFKQWVDTQSVERVQGVRVSLLSCLVRRRCVIISAYLSWCKRPLARTPDQWRPRLTPVTSHLSTLPGDLEPRLTYDRTSPARDKRTDGPWTAIIGYFEFLIYEP